MSLSFDNSEAGCMLFYDCHRSVPAPFLTKTYHLVNDPSTNEIVSWGEDDTTFVVWRPPEFARDLLPNYFKHNNFSSFVRQLNTYGFRKVVPDRWEFANDFFRRGERHLLCEIHRRKALQPASGTSGSAQQSRSLSPSTSLEDQPWASPISSPLPSPIPAAVHIVPTQQQYHSSTVAPSSAAPLSISDENERLRKDNNLLLSEVSRLRRLYEETIHMIQYQFKGSPPDFTRMDCATSTVLSGAERRWWPGPSPAAEVENRELSVHVNFCKNTPPPQQQQVFHSESSTSPPPVKLFGVPLQNAGSKRRQPEPPFLRPPPRKCLRSSAEMMAADAGVQSPWLQIGATRDEGVYI